MIYVSSENNNINYAPKSNVEDVIRNVEMILRVYKEEQPLNRDFAFDSDLIDKNINVVENRITTDLLKSLRKYEPRAVLKTTQITMTDKYKNEFEITLGIEVIEIE